MSFPRYPKYKASGVEWLGEVPDHWEIKRLRFVAELNPSKSEVGSLDRETAVSFLPMEAIGDDGTLSLDTEKAICEVESGYTYFRDGDITIAKITPCYENGKGALMQGLANGIGFGTTELIVARPKPKEITGTYLYYLSISPDFRKLGESHMYGAGGQKRVPDAFVRNFTTAFPPIAEQTQVVAFLDQETAKIDGLVAEQQRLIELLKEKRQAVISHAITKGLNPDAPLKPSGIEWPCEVPADWDVKRMKYLVADGDGIQMGPFGGMLLDLDFEETGFKVYGQENTISGDFSLGRRWISKERYAALSNYHVDVGDLLLTRKGSLGNARLIQALPQPGIVDSDTIRVRVNRSLIMQSFLAILLHEAQYVAEQITLSKRGAILPGLNSETIADISIILPPLDQQQKLMEFLGEHIAKLDTLIAEAQHAIDLLQERRTAIISAATTGQIDVRPLNKRQAV